MSNFPEENPNVYLGFGATSFDQDGWPTEIGIAGPDVEIHHFIKPAQSWTHWSEAQAQIQAEQSGAEILTRQFLETAGIDIGKLAQQLNSQFDGKTLYCDANLDIGLMAMIFSEAGITQSFQVENLLDGWVTEMIDDFERHAYDQRTHQALGDAKAIKHAHESMIPF